MALTTDDLVQRILKQVGPLSPLRVTCDAEEKVTFDHLEVTFDWELLSSLFYDSEKKFSSTEVSLLSYYDHYLDLPLVELTLRPSYAALKRVLEIATDAYVPVRKVFSVIDKKFLCEEAIKKGDLSVLKWARQQQCHWDKWSPTYAAELGHLEILQWLHEAGCPWDGHTCSYAAFGGQLEVLQWARSQGCPWDSWTCACAAEQGHLAVLQWARSQGCSWDQWTCIYAAGHGQLEVIQWAYAHGCPWNRHACMTWAENQPHVLQWLKTCT